MDSNRLGRTTSLDGEDQVGLESSENDWMESEPADVEEPVRIYPLFGAQEPKDGDTGNESKDNYVGEGRSGNDST